MLREINNIESLQFKSPLVKLFLDFLILCRVEKRNKAKSLKLNQPAQPNYT